MRVLFLPLLPLVLPFAVRWARRLEAMVLRDGSPLDAQGLRDAKAMGVPRPEAVRVMLVDAIPAPRNPLLRLGAAATGLLSPMTAGLALGHAILVRRDCHPDRLMIAHECVHVAQYERFGGLKPFLRQYLRECLVYGYLNSPLEQEAVQKSSSLAGDS